MAIYSNFEIGDVYFLLIAFGRTLLISGIAISLGTLLGILMGWILFALPRYFAACLSECFSIFRSIPLLIQLLLFDSFLGIMNVSWSPFATGLSVLSFFVAVSISVLVRAGLESVSDCYIKASQSLGMNYFQTLFFIVAPLGLRFVFPTWVGVVLGTFKDSALVSVLGYLEILKASQDVITKTQMPFPVLLLSGFLYFVVCLETASISRKIEKRWNS